MTTEMTGGRFDRKEGIRCLESSGGLAHFRFNLLPEFTLSLGQFVSGLEIHPEPCAVPEVPGKPEGCFCRQSTLPVKDLRNSARRNPKCEGQFIGRKATFRHFAFENTSRVNWFHHGLPLVVIYDFNIVSIAVLKKETDAPWAVHRHSPFARLCRRITYEAQDF